VHLHFGIKFVDFEKIIPHFHFSETSNTLMMSTAANNNQVGNHGGNHAGNHSYSNRVTKFIVIEPFHESTIYQDGSNMYQVKVAKLDGVPKVGITRFWYSHEAQKFLPGHACFMTGSAWFALVKQVPDITKHFNSMIDKCRCHCDIASSICSVMSHCCTYVGANGGNGGGSSGASVGNNGDTRTGLVSGQSGCGPDSSTSGNGTTAAGSAPSTSDCTNPQATPSGSVARKRGRPKATEKSGDTSGNSSNNKRSKGNGGANGAAPTTAGVFTDKERAEADEAAVALSIDDADTGNDSSA